MANYLWIFIYLIDELIKIALNMIEEMKILVKDQETLTDDATDLFTVQTGEDFEDADVLGTISCWI